MSNIRRTLALSILATALTAPLLHAQATADAKGASCLAAIPQTAYKRVLVYLWPSTGAQRAGFAELSGMVTEDIGRQLRVLLGSAADRVPAADARIDWRDLDHAILVTARRDGHIVADADSSDHSAASALLRAIVDSMDKRHDFLPWPPTETVDEFSFKLHVVPAQVTRGGEAVPISERPLIPAFSLSRPWLDPVQGIAENRGPTYPPEARLKGIEAQVRLSFVVDAAGAVDMTTLEDSWNPEEPRPTGMLADYYGAFLDAAVSALATHRFVPAQIGGCTVRQRVQQTFTFELGK
ncbi:MAG: TonB family protein [Gemmatimonadetes bacterium]|nr:TonB family protein [Gemmatimonadota bacterium]